MKYNKERLLRVIYVDVLLFLLLIGYYFLNKKFDFVIECPINHFTGYLCPGCGITRCLFSILEFKFKKAFYYNQLVFILIPFFLIYYIYDVYTFIFEKEKKSKIFKYMSIPLLVITILFGIVRNII